VAAERRDCGWDAVLEVMGGRPRRRQLAQSTADTDLLLRSVGQTEEDKLKGGLSSEHDEGS